MNKRVDACILKRLAAIETPTKFQTAALISLAATLGYEWSAAGKLTVIVLSIFSPYYSLSVGMR
jgi:hypothetical protein